MNGRLRIVPVGILVVSLMGGCAQIGQMSKTTKGAALGGLTGAAVGGIVGGQVGHPVIGAAIGGTVGALGGGLVGRSLDQQDQVLSERQAKLDQQRKEVERNRALIEELKRSNIEARETDRGITVNLPNVLFAFDNARLSLGGRTKVTRIADALRRHATARRISVEGHASRERSGQAAEVYNQDLSARRAQSVAKSLIESGISEGRITSKGFGTRFPLASNETETGRRKNRRVEVIIEN